MWHSTLSCCLRHLPSLSEALGSSPMSASDPAPCQCAWEAAGDSLSTWVPVTQVKDLDRVRGFWFWPGPAVTVTENQSVGWLSISLFVFQINEHFLLFKIYFIYLKGRVTKRRRERRRGLFHLLIHVPNDHDSQGYCQARAEARSSSESPTRGLVPKDLDHLLVLSQVH